MSKLRRSSVDLVSNQGRMWLGNQTTCQASSQAFDLESNSVPPTRRGAADLDPPASTNPQFHVDRVWCFVWGGGLFAIMVRRTKTSKQAQQTDQPCMCQATRSKSRLTRMAKDCHHALTRTKPRRTHTWQTTGSKGLRAPDLETRLHKAMDGVVKRGVKTNRFVSWRGLTSYPLRTLPCRRRTRTATRNRADIWGLWKIVRMIDPSRARPPQHALTSAQLALIWTESGPTLSNIRPILTQIGPQVSAEIAELVESGPRLPEFGPCAPQDPYAAPPHPGGLT